MVPGSESIGEAIARLTEQGSLGWTMPGPLDGHYRPAETGMNRLSEDDIERFAEDLANGSDASILSTLAYLSQRYDLGEKLLKQMLEKIQRRALPREETGFNERIGRLIDAGFIASAQRNEGLTNAIASTVVTMAHQAHSSSETAKILQALLTAGAAFQREDAWAEWLERQLADVAGRLPGDEPSKTLYAHLQELKKVLKLNLGIHVRAEALASAAN